MLFVREGEAPRILVESSRCSPFIRRKNKMIVKKKKTAANRRD